MLQSSPTSRRRAAVAASVIMFAATLAVAIGANPAHAARTASCAGLEATIVGSVGDDVIVGTAGDDVINAGKGNDTIHGGGGNDVLCGGKGIDAIFGGPGDDYMKGGPSGDYLFGNSGRDQIFGNRGRDIVDGGIGPDGCSGEATANRCESAAGGAPASASEPTASIELEATAVVMVNELRARHGIAPLATNGHLAEVARGWAATLSDRDSLAHNPNFDDQILGHWALVGENVGYGPTLATIQRSLEASPSHRQNILRPEFTDVGIGIVVAGDRLWLTQNFADYDS